MLSLGATLKKLRLARGITQADLYGGIVSRSFAGRLERGEHDVTVETFWAILDRLAVSADEFRFLQQEDHPSDALRLEGQIGTAYSQQNFPWLRHLVQRYQTSTDPQERELATVADLALRSFGSASWTPTPAMLTLWQHFNQLTTWGLHELRLGTAWLEIAQGQHQPAVLWAGIQKMHASCARYVSPTADPFHVTDLRASFDLVAMQILLLGQVQFRPYRTYAQTLYRALKAYDRWHLSTDAALSREICLCLWDWYDGDVAAADRRAATLENLPPLSASLNTHAILTSHRRHALRQRQKRGDSHA